MAVNLGLDDKVTTAEGLTASSTGFAQAMIDFIKQFRSSANPFGALALLDEAPGQIPPGAMLEFGGTAAPTGYLLCDGASVSRTTYADLYAAIGTRFGSASGTTFNVPDFRRRIALGAGGTVPGGTNGPAATVGSSGGDEEIILSESQLPAHTHDISALTVIVPGGAQSRNPLRPGIRSTERTPSPDRAGRPHIRLTAPSRPKAQARTLTRSAARSARPARARTWA